MKRLLALTLLALLPAGPASAALVSTYSMTDDVWGTPVGAGRILFDVRGSYVPSNPSVLSLPTGSLVFGVTPWLELGANASYLWSGLGTNQSTQSASPATAYVKLQAPWKPGGSSLGLVVGAQVPTVSDQEHNVAAELAGSFPLSDALTFDLNLGAGMRLVQAGYLGHAGASLYYALPAGHTAMVEGYGYYNALAPGMTYGQRLGYLIPLSSSNSLDFSVAVQELSSTLRWVPQLGTTLMF